MSSIRMHLPAYCTLQCANDQVFDRLAIAADADTGASRATFAGASKNTNSSSPFSKDDVFTRMGTATLISAAF